MSVDRIILAKPLRLECSLLVYLLTFVYLTNVLNICNVTDILSATEDFVVKKTSLCLLVTSNVATNR